MTLKLLGCGPGIILNADAEGGNSGVAVDGAGKFTINNNGGELSFFQSPFAQAYRWKGAQSFKMSDWGGAVGSKVHIYLLALNGGSIRRLFVVKESSTEYKLALVDNAGTVIVLGTTKYLFGVTYYMLAETNGTTLSVWWGNLTTAEVTEAGAWAMTDIAQQIGSTAFNTSGSGTFECVRPWAADGISTDTRPDPTTIAALVKTPTSGTPMWDEYTFDEAGAGATTKWDSVDEWGNGSGQDDDATWLEQPAAASTTYRQTFKTTGGTLTREAYWGQIVTRWRPNIASKNISANVLSGDGTNLVEGPNNTLTIITFVTARLLCPLAPDGGPWSQTDIDNWQVGVRWNVGVDPVSLRTTEVVGLMCGINAQSGTPPVSQGPDRPPQMTSRGTRVIERPRPDSLLIVRPEGANLRILDEARRSLDKRLRE